MGWEWLKDWYTTEGPRAQVAVNKVSDEVIAHLKELIPDWGKIVSLEGLEPLLQHYMRKRNEAWQTELAYKKVTASGSVLGAIPFMSLGDIADEYTHVPSMEASVKRAVETFTSEFTDGQRPLMRRLWLRAYTPLIPDPQTLARLRAKGFMADEDYRAWLQQNGLHGSWYGAYYMDQYQIPSVETLLTLLRRGIMSIGEFCTALTRIPLNPDYFGHIYQLRWELPGYGDMISVYMKEGYMAEKWTEIPQEFVNFMSQLGYSEFWAYRLWGKHWVLPGVNHLYEMFHKKIITYDEMATMLRYHDFEPIWRHRLIENAYTMVPRVDIRRGYVWGLLGSEELQTRYEKLGYSAADAALMADIAKRFGLSAYYSRLLSVAAANFRKGQLPGPDFQGILEVCGLPVEAQDLLLNAETMARDAAVTEPGEEPRILTAGQVCTAYTKGLLSLSVAKKRLLGLGYLEGDADLLLQLATPKPEAMETNRELVSAASLLYRNGLLSRDLFGAYLRKAGLSEAEIAMKVDAEDLRYRLDFVTDLINMAKEAFRKDVYTAEEFEAYLRFYGMERERALTLVSIEELRKLPKPKPGA